MISFLLHSFLHWKLTNEKLKYNHTLNELPDLMKFFSSTLSSAGSSSCSTSSMRRGRPCDKASSRCWRKYLWLSVVTYKRNARGKLHINKQSSLSLCRVAFSKKQTTLTTSSRFFSLFFVQFLPWPWGSISRGKRVALVTMIPFRIDRSSPGSPCKFHSPI